MENQTTRDVKDTPQELEEVLKTRDNESPSGGELSFGITLDDGLKRVPIRNTLGQEIGAFFFRPTDLGMVDRFNEAVSRFSEVTELLDRLPEDDEGRVDMNLPGTAQILRTAREKLFELCDYAFGGKMSDAFFGSMDPFSPVNGNLYCMNVLTALGDFISGQFQRETEKLNSRVKKYMPEDHLGKGGKRRGR